jgi:GNAT superfamily N-acetyltransferase
MEIRELAPGEYDEALGLAKQVFMEFEAPDYSEEGVRSFFGSLDDPGFVAMLRVYGAYDRGQLVGMLATRSGGGHIALFFVDRRHQGRGIGRKLFDLACQKSASVRMTVNASPYARGIYHHLGFIDTGSEQTTNGIRYTPMVRMLNGDNALSADVS